MAVVRIPARGLSSLRGMLARASPVDLTLVRWLTRHALAGAVVVLSVAATGGVLAFARPEYKPHVALAKPGTPLYMKVSYQPGAVRRVFAEEGIGLTLRSRGSWGTTLGNARDVLEVDVFGDPIALKNAGFSDLVLGRDCAASSRLAERWRGNVRVIVNCAIADHGQRWVDRVNHALARLGATA
jgi:hypothetical protein